jgi:hypothetical protein
MAEAAVRAASRTGTEVQPTRVAGAEAGRRGPWVLLRRRKPTDLLSPEQMEETAEATPSAEAVG